jgi:integrase
MNRLTDLKIRNFSAPTEQMLSDGFGLYLKVRPNSTIKAWIYRFTQNRKTQKMQIGTYPHVGLAEARALARELDKEHKSGLNPVIERNRKKEEVRLEAVEEASKKTVQEVFNLWAKIDLATHKDGGASVYRIFKKDVLPAIGSLRIEDVTKGHVIAVIDSVLARGARRMAKVTFSLLRQMFRFAVDRDILTIDPTQSLRKAKIGGKDTERDRVLSDAEIQHLAHALPSSSLREPYQLALWIMLSTLCRIGELTRARWSDVDITRGTWRIPKENSKNGRSHVIRLSPFARDLFCRLKLLQAESQSSQTNESEWIYPARNGTKPIHGQVITKQISDRQKPTSRLAKRAAGATSESLILPDGKWGPHDLRRSGATIMVAQGVLPAVVERCLNHTEERKLIRIYQHYGYQNEMQSAWERLGSQLSRLTNFRPDRSRRVA